MHQECAACGMLVGVLISTRVRRWNSGLEPEEFVVHDECVPKLYAKWESEADGKQGRSAQVL